MFKPSKFDCILLIFSIAKKRLLNFNKYSKKTEYWRINACPISTYRCFLQKLYHRVKIEEWSFTIVSFIQKTKRSACHWSFVQSMYCFEILYLTVHAQAEKHNDGILTLKLPRKPASENVVCLRRLLNILANFSNLFLHTGKQCGPRSDCSSRSSLIWVHTVCKNDF